MKRIMNYLMLSCKKATELIEKKLTFGLSWKENIQLKMHTKMCDACAHYQKQSKDIDILLENHLKKGNDAIPEIQNDELKTEILHSLEQ